jgi:hypothetical protein
MRSIESDQHGTKPQSPVDQLATSENSGAVVCCPECGASFRLAGSSSGERAGRSTRPDWLPTANTAASPLPAAASNKLAGSIDIPSEPAISGSDAPTPIWGLNSSSTPSEVSLSDAADEEDEPTRAQPSLELPAVPGEDRAREPHDLENSDSAGSPLAQENRDSGKGQVSGAVQRRQRPPLPERHGGGRPPAQLTTGMAPGVPSNPADVEPKPSPQSISREVLSDAPLIRDAKPTRPYRSAANSVALFGLGIAVAIAFVAYNRSRPTDPKLSGSPAGAALTPILPVSPAAPVVSSGSALGASSGEPTELAIAAVKAARVATQDRQPQPKVKAPSSAVQPATDDPEKTQPAIRDRQPQAKAADPPSEAQAGFDTEEAASALDSAAQGASSCRQAEDPSGVAVVTITFAPSGRVTTATIAGPPFVGTATGSCIAAKMRTARVPAFAGPFVTVRKTVTIR